MQKGELQSQHMEKFIKRCQAYYDLIAKSLNNKPMTKNNK